jgi:EamA domain-containing membrane protein RarD
MSTLVTGICVWSQEKPFYIAFTDSTWQVWTLIVVLSILNNLGQNLNTWINQRANPATIGIMQYMGVTFSFMFDVFLFN